MTSTEMTQEETTRVALFEATAELRAAESRHHELVTAGMRSSLNDPTRAARFAELAAVCDRMDDALDMVLHLLVVLDGFDEE